MMNAEWCQAATDPTLS